MPAITLLLGNPPPQVHLRERDSALAAEHTNLRKDLLYEILALGVQVLKR
jgi:hypothetical protein